MMGKILPEKHVELILQINKSLLHLVGSSILLYLIDDARSKKIKSNGTLDIGIICYAEFED